MALGMGTFFPMEVGTGGPGNSVDSVDPADSVDGAAARLAELLSDGGTGLRDATGRDLVFEPSLEFRPLERGAAPVEAWAVDGGQALVADARCVQLYVTRAARVCWAGGRSVVEEEGELHAALLGLGEDRRTLASLGAPVDPDASVDVNLLRDWGEWAMVSSCVDEASPGAVVMVDGDLQPDWRIASSWLSGVVERASRRGVALAGVTKHTSLSWGSAPLLGLLERRAESSVGERAMWWVPVARTRPDVGPGIQVVVARLDPDARFAFRVDVAGDADTGALLAGLAALCDDAAFPGYPYPLSVADRLAACPPAVRDDVWNQVNDVFDVSGLPLDVRDRAFADRHRLMERY